jgi:hypothetical protein
MPLKTRRCSCVDLERLPSGFASFLHRLSHPFREEGKYSVILKVSQDKHEIVA